MTNQEIFDDLGEIGTLMLLFMEMAGADGEFDKSELIAIHEAAQSFTDGDLDDFFQNAIKIRKSLSFEDRIAYINSGLGYFAENLEPGNKKSILNELAKIANADGAIHNNESLLYKMAFAKLSN
jgi:uncharacterized tellurite resistance protein B-like protein